MQFLNPNSLKTMKNSNPRCVPAILKTASLAAILAVPATSFAAGSYSDDLRAWESSLSQEEKGGSSPTKASVPRRGNEAFDFADAEDANWTTFFGADLLYAKSLTEQKHQTGYGIYKKEKPDFYGAILRCGMKSKRPIEGTELAPEFFVDVGCGESAWVDLLWGNIGGNLHYMLSDGVSAYGGVRAGICYCCDYASYDDYDDEETGLSYGVGGGFDVSLGEHVGNLVLGATFFATTKKTDTYNPKCVIFSVGYKIAF